MELSLHHPTDGFYRGTRFDHSGIFSSLQLDGEELCGPWFETYHPDAHDAVQGPSEEFSPIPVTESTLLKIGVGLLEADSASYDRFRLYPVAEAGTWDVLPGTAAVTFRHILPGFYTYTKEIVLTGASSCGGIVAIEDTPFDIGREEIGESQDRKQQHCQDIRQALL